MDHFNASMKNTLLMYVHREPNTWYRLLPYVLFVYREIRVVGNGFSQFEPAWEWPVRGQLSIVNDSWLDGNNDEESVIDYVLRMRSHLFQCVDSMV